MEAIIEEYGLSLLQMAGGAGVLALLWSTLGADGAVYMLLLRYMTGICG